MTLRDLGTVLLWLGAGAVLAILAVRAARGAWSLEDEEVPPVSLSQKLAGAVALAAALAGAVLVVRSLA